MNGSSAPWWTLDRLAEVTGTSVAHLRRAIKSGDLAAKRDGRGVNAKYIVGADAARDWYERRPDAEVTR